MASDYNSDDTLNVIEDHLIQALQADAKLGASGALEIKTWEQEHRDDISSYMENQLPAVSVEVGIQPPQDITIGDHVEYTYPATLLLVMTGGNLSTQRKDLKYRLARIVRVLQQQHYPSKQLVSLPDDLDGADPQGVQVVVESVFAAMGESERNPNVLRGFAEIAARVHVALTIPED